MRHPITPVLRLAPLAAAALIMGTAQAAAFASAWSSPLHAAAAPRVAGSSSQDEEPGRKVGEVNFVDLSFDDAMSRAERLQKILVVYWTGGNQVKNRAFEKQLLEDKAVQAWLKDNAVTVHIDTEVRQRDFRRNNLKNELIPCCDMLDLARGGRIERLFGDADSTRFMAAVYGIGEAKRPTGTSATEPFQWLAWGNAQFRNVGDPNSGKEAVAAYSWCLSQADVYRPGFRAKYIEFILERLAYCKQRTPDALAVLDREQKALARQIQLGTANVSHVYEMTRVHFWMRQESLTRDVFTSLRGKGKAQEQARRWLFPTVVPVLGRFEQYGEILELVGDDAVPMFQDRIDTLARSVRVNSGIDADSAASADGPTVKTDAEIAKDAETQQGEAAAAEEAKDERPLTRFDMRDARADVIEDASWVFETLVAMDKKDNAKELFTLISANYPFNKTFGTFTERALRLEEWALAMEIADLGMAALDERGQRRMQRLLQKIPKDAKVGETSGAGK